MALSTRSSRATAAAKRAIHHLEKAQLELRKLSTGNMVTNEFNLGQAQQIRLDVATAQGRLDALASFIAED